MGRTYQRFLDSDRVYTCNTCHAHLASYGDVISRGFHGRQGPAYLFDKVVNVSYGRKEPRSLMTGLHTVVDIHCGICQVNVGWKYIKAYEHSQKYKEGRFVLEKHRIVKETQWKD
ncbi:hypothetical protein IWQ61_001624 [Dispira simplex]|nr:hypothetical protein IWQ61_001624 [Dispira simplex]